MLKEEVARLRPDLKPAFSRPGLVTFKAPAEVRPDVELGAVFARVWGASLGPISAEEAVAAAHTLEPKALRLHVFARGDEPPGEVPIDLPRGPARAGELVLDAITAAGEPTFFGVHRHVPGRWAWAGGRPPIYVPPDAPSRAFHKLQEGLVWSHAHVMVRDVAVEIGSSPGGASYALLRRKVTVVGVDPGEMAEPVKSHPGFTHVRKSLGDVRREDLPERADWLLLDVNLAPQVALHQVRRIVAYLRPTLKGLLFTLKLNEWSMAADVPELVRRVEAMKIGPARATHLPSGRQEVFVASLRPAGRS